MAIPKIKIDIATILVSGFILRIILMLFSASHPDIGNHVDWGNRFFEYTPKNFYTAEIWSVSKPNQPFGSIYLFAVVSKIYKSLMSFSWYLNNNFPIFPSKLILIFESSLHHWLLKIPFIAADIVIAFIIYKIGQKYFSKKSLLAAGLFLFNPVVIYNSTIWGQTDSLINLLALAGIFLLTQKKFFWGIILFFSSFLFKLSLIIYLPIVALLLLSYFPKYTRIIFVSCFSFLLFFIFLAFPFSGINIISWFKKIFIDTVLLSQGHMLNGNAFNFWFLINGGADLTTSELQLFSIFTYRQISQIIFFILNIPIYWHFYKSKKNLYNIFYTLFLVALSAFLFLTNMHERYLYPCLPLLASLPFFVKSIFSIKEYLVFSFLHLLNLFNLWWYPSIPFLKNTLIWDNFLVGKIISILFIIYFFTLTYHVLMSCYYTKLKI